MTVEAISALASSVINAAPSLQSAVANADTLNAATKPGEFDGMVRALQNLNVEMTTNQQAVESLAVGETDDLHRVMMNLQSTKLSFDLMLQVRNKVLDAYQELMRMQI